ncbi:MAG TPA: pitrilysin family protein, partial [Pyrinomonadaceae bacterium]|nr:pitrilysin family protein [Pyrinomonadaceae bacterium]
MKISFFQKTSVLLVVFAIAASAFAQTGKIENLAAQAATVSEFDVNGLKVILKQRATAPTVAVGLFVRGGSANLTDKNAGIEDLMLNSAIEGGKQFPRQSVRRELARTGGAISAGASTDYSVVSFSSTRKSFDRIWDIFSDVVLNPAFAPADVERIRTQLSTRLSESEADGDGALNALSSRTLYAGHPYKNDPNGTPANIASFTVDDLRNYHRDVMQTSRLLLVVVGDVDAAQLKTLVAASFGKLPKGNYQAKPLPPIDFSKPTLDVTKRVLPTNYVEGVFSAPSLSSPDFYAMRVATTVLQQRIFEEVRVQRQLSYAPNADMNNNAANTGNIYVSAVDAKQAVAVMLDEVKRLQNVPITSDEISGMAGQYLTTYYLGQETNVAQARSLAEYELIGGGWRNSFEFLNHIREV